MLLAKCLVSTQADFKWRHAYIEFMMSPSGEYVQTEAGWHLLTLIAGGPSEPLAEWSPVHSQLAVVDQDAFCKVNMFCMRSPCHWLWHLLSIIVKIH